jgi:nucleoside-diphosphate-sugar epimerase
METGMAMDRKIILPGGAGLVGQNLVARLKQRGYTGIVVLDKHAANLDILRRHHPDIVAEVADLARPGAWQRHFAGAAAVVMLQQYRGYRHGAGDIERTRRSLSRPYQFVGGRLRGG